MSTDNQATLHAFDADIEQFAKVVDIAPRVVMRRIVLDAHTRITKRTPVDTGRARASWDVKNGAPSNFIPPITVGKVDPASANGKDISKEIASITGTMPVYITTAIDYMKYLEDGSSKQSPAGMVRISMAEIEIEIEDIIAHAATDLP